MRPGFRSTPPNEKDRQSYNIKPVISKVYEFTGQCNEKGEECAKRIKWALRKVGIEARHIRGFSRIFVAEGEIPEPYAAGFKEIPSQPISEALGFDEHDITYLFGNGRGITPYDILRLEPYKCHSNVIDVVMYYENSEYRKKLKELLRPYLLNKKQLSIKYQKLKWLDDLRHGQGVKVALLSENALNRMLETIAKIKVGSYKSELGVSTLQIVNGDKLLKIGVDGAEYFAANLLSAIYFKAGCVPFYVELPMRLNAGDNDALRLHRALYIGVGIGRSESGYVKAAAVIMTGHGEILTYLHHDFRSNGKSMEFDENELKKFIEIIEGEVENFARRHGEPALLAVVRSRQFHESEWRSIKRPFSRFWLSLKSRGVPVLLMSWYDTKDYIGKGNAVQIGPKEVKGGIHGVWLLQLSKFKHAVQLSYYSTIKNPVLPATAYIYLRELDFTSLTKNRTKPAPVKYVHKYLKWLIRTYDRRNA